MAVHIPLATIYLHHISSNTKRYAVTEKKRYLAKQAKTLFLRACEISPTSTSWLGVGKACIVLGELDQAENALSEANILNNRDGQVWASLAQLSLLQDRTYEANQAIAQAFKHDVRDVDVLVDLASLFSQHGNVKHAVSCLEIALEQLCRDMQGCKDVKMNFEMNRELGVRQRRRQYEIENFITRVGGDGEEVGERVCDDGGGEDDVEIGGRIEAVKELLSAALSGGLDLRQMEGVTV
jgi:hypothetical protein